MSLSWPFSLPFCHSVEVTGLLWWVKHSAMAVGVTNWDIQPSWNLIGLSNALFVSCKVRVFGKEMKKHLGKKGKISEVFPFSLFALTYSSALHSSVCPSVPPSLPPSIVKMNTRHIFFPRRDGHWSGFPQRIVWPLSQGGSAQRSICGMWAVICKLRTEVKASNKVVWVSGLGTWTVVTGRIQRSLSQDSRPKQRIKTKLS